MSARVMIVTGGASGIGLACARRFLKDGFHVVVADNDEEAGQVALDEFEAYGEKLAYISCDVSDTLSVHNLIVDTLNQFGYIDVLINNAAILKKGGILDLSLSDYEEILAVNLRGVFLTSQAVAKYMVGEIEDREDRSRLTERPYSIINMSSIHDHMAIANSLGYVVSKGGLRQMTQALAIELAAYGIRVNAIGPGGVNTGMLAGQMLADEENKDHILKRTPLGRWATPDEIAGVAAFLASEDASYITGETIYVDGGRLAFN